MPRAEQRCPLAEPNPLDHEELYDVVTVAGQRSPGQATLSDHDREIGWDVKKAAGQAGASITRTSEEPVEFTLTLFLADREDFAAWPAFRELLRSTSLGTKPKALDIYHPDLAANDIKSVVLKKIGGVVHDGQGGQTIAIRLLEYRPAKPKGGSPTGSKAKGPDPDQAALDELAALTKQYEVTPWG